MVDHAPSFVELLILVLAAYRIYRLVAKDTITEPVRAALSYPDGEAVTLDTIEERGRLRLHNRMLVYGEAGPKSWRVYVSTLLRCPWCAGFYVSIGVWLAWAYEPRWTLVGGTLAAVSAGVGLIGKLDE